MTYRLIQAKMDIAGSELVRMTEPSGPTAAGIFELRVPSLADATPTLLHHGFLPLFPSSFTREVWHFPAGGFFVVVER